MKLLGVKEFVNDLREKNLDLISYVENLQKKLKEINEEYSYFNFLSEDIALKAESVLKEKTNGKILGLPISIKDCICVKDMPSSAGAKIIKNYKPVFNASVVERLLKEGAIIIGKTAQDEFGFGSFSVNTYNIPKNPHDKERSCGGSSGGSAGITVKLAQENFTHVSIAESTGGSIACPASFCGCYGYTPTYGLISRYGLIDYANSLDKIGIMAPSLEDIKIVLEIIKGHDPKDSTSLNKELNNDTSVKKVAIIKECFDVNEEIKEAVLSKLNNLNYEEISLPITQKYGLACYYIIALAEASTNLAKYCGLRYGEALPLDKSYNEYFKEVRTKYFNTETKRRIILGTFTRMAGYRDAFYLKAAKIRRLIIQEYKRAFKKYDLLISPTMPIIAPKFSEIKKLTPLEMYMMDVLTVGPNLAGLPHLSLNAGFSKKEKMPIGMMLIANHLNDLKLFNLP